MKTKNIEPGQWFMKESYITGCMGYPLVVTKVVKSRVYFERPRRNRDGSIDYMEPGHCQMKSIRMLVDSEGKGVEIWEKINELREIERKEIREVNKRFDGYVRDVVSNDPASNWFSA